MAKYKGVEYRRHKRGPAPRSKWAFPLLAGLVAVTAYLIVRGKQAAPGDKITVFGNRPVLPAAITRNPFDIRS